MSTPRLALLFAAFLAVFLLATLPLQLALRGTGLSARNASGSLWRGRLEAAAWHGLAIGDVTLGLAPLPLLTGARRVDFATATMAGRLRLSGSDVAVEGLTGSVSPGGFGGLLVTSVRFSDFGSRFDGGRCQSAGGSLTIEPGGPLAGAGGFAGTPRCDGDRLLLPLQAPGGRLDLRMAGDGRYAATISVDSADAGARPRLLASGFQATPTGLALSLQGQL